MSSFRDPHDHSATAALSADADHVQAGPSEQSAAASASDGGRGAGQPRAGDGAVGSQVHGVSNHCSASVLLLNLTYYISRESKTARNVLWSHASVCVSVCLSAAACLQYCTDPDVTWGSGRGCPLVVHYWADLQHYGNAWQSPAVIRQAQCTPHALRRHARTSDKMDAPATCATLSATRPFHFVHTAWVLQRECEMLASTCLYSLYA